MRDMNLKRILLKHTKKSKFAIFFFLCLYLYKSKKYIQIFNKMIDFANQKVQEKIESHMKK